MVSGILLEGIFLSWIDLSEAMTVKTEMVDSTEGEVPPQNAVSYVEVGIGEISVISARR